MLEKKKRTKISTDLPFLIFGKAGDAAYRLLAFSSSFFYFISGTQ